MASVITAPTSASKLLIHSATTEPKGVRRLLILVFLGVFLILLLLINLFQWWNRRRYLKG